MASFFHDEMQFEIHELSQPLTTLRLRLELAMMQRETHAPACEGLWEAVESGLMDIQRIFESVERLRSRLMMERERQSQKPS